MPIKMPQKAGQPYRPSNGTEGMKFEAKYCEQCNNYNDNMCRIAFDVMLYEINEPEYPKEWVFDSEGSPTCTAFEKL